MGLMSYMSHRALAMFLVLVGFLVLLWGASTDKGAWVFVVAILIFLASAYFFKTRHT